MKTSLACLLGLATCAGVQAGPPWHHPLSLANRGYWSARMPVTVTNGTAAGIEGEPVDVPLDALAGEPVDTLRVCDADGRELLHEVTDGRGMAKRSTDLAAGDRLLLPATCPAGGTAEFFVYAGNRRAWPPAEFLPAGFRNGGFEAGAPKPEGWSAATTDSAHRAALVDGAGRGGGRAALVEADAGAEPTWVQWQQDRIPVRPGCAYELRGWVRAESVDGIAGFYVHVHGETPQMLNRHADAGRGSFDWREVSLSFVAPTGAQSATVGTVLHGTGRAWFDDVSFRATAGGPRPAARCGPVERVDLEAPAPRPPEFREGELLCATVQAIHPGVEAAESILLAVDLRPVGGRWFNYRPGGTARVVDAASGQAVPGAFWLPPRLVFPCSLPPRSLRQFHVFLSTNRAANATTAPDAAVAAGNLAPPPVQAAAGSVTGWQFNGDAASMKARIIEGTPSGRGFEFVVPAGAPEAWRGWVSPPIPIRAGTTYLLGGRIRAVDGGAHAAIHAHLHGADGKLVASGAMLSTRAAGGGDDWALTHTTFRAPVDAATVRIHLTMNGPGTLRHDGVFLREVREGEVAGFDVRGAPRDGPWRVWTADPLVKIFRDDPPGPAAGPLRLDCAAGERECVQLAVFAGARERRVSVSVEPPRDAAGAALPPVAVERVHYVPVDHPTAYYHDESPAWVRKIPRGDGSTDGWAGEWPDALVPFAAGEVRAGENLPLWVTVRADPGTRPGVRRGTIRIRCEGEREVALPLEVNVLPFEIPARPRLRALLDLRTGPGGDFASGVASGDGRRAWLRLLAEHRIGLHEIRPQPVFTRSDGVVRMDATAFDEEARYCFDELQMAVAYTPHFFYAFGWAYPPRKLFGLEPLTPEYDEALRQCVRLFGDHARTRGWRDRFAYYISDEPHFNHAFVVEQMKRLCATIHSAGGGFPIYSSTWRPCPEWNDSLDLWGVGQYGCFPVAELERLKAAGKGFWFTCDGQMAIDTPFLATERLLPYYCFKYGAGGFEFWGATWWTHNPWERGWHTFISQSDDGRRHYWIRYPNGDGYLAYPGAPGVAEGPVSTIRLEAVREGMEDYEALKTLEDLAAAAPPASPAARAAREALAAARALVDIPNSGGLRSLDLLPDPTAVGRVRREINRAIERLATEGVRPPAGKEPPG